MFCPNILQTDVVPTPGSLGQMRGMHSVASRLSLGMSRRGPRSQMTDVLACLLFRASKSIKEQCQKAAGSFPQSLVPLSTGVMEVRPAACRKQQQAWELCCT